MALNIPLPGANFGGIVAGIPEEMQQNRLRQAQEQRELAKSRLPFGGEIPPGPAGQTVGLEMIKMLYGENSPQYIQAKNSYDLNNKSIRSRVNYQDILSDTAGKRFATQEGKRAQEQQDIEQGYMPGTKVGSNEGTPLSDEQRDKLKGLYSNKALKDATDTNVRQRIIYAKNMEQTLNSINPDDLTSYSGINGTAEFFSDSTSSLFGETPPKLLKYQKALTAADALAKQVRQFYGDSITKGVQEGLKELTNPTSWSKSPEIAKAKFIYFRDKILRAEAKNFYSAAKSANIYEQPKEENVVFSNSPQNKQKNENDIENGLMTLVDPSGREHKIFRNNLEAAQKKYPELKVKKESFNAAKI